MFPKIDRLDALPKHGRRLKLEMFENTAEAAMAQQRTMKDHVFGVTGTTRERLIPINDGGAKLVLSCALSFALAATGHRSAAA